jgi:hypothetical protein
MDFTLAYQRSIALCIAISVSGCVVDGGQDGDENFMSNESLMEEESTEEITEETMTMTSEETMTTTTVVETPSTDPTNEITCSAVDQGFGDAMNVDVFVVSLPEECLWSETSADLESGVELGFDHIDNDEDYLALFNCEGMMLSSDVNWETEVVVYLSGWVPEGSLPTFEWAVEGTDNEVVLGLVSENLCAEEDEFFQSAFIAPKRNTPPRVISCTMPNMCE